MTLIHLIMFISLQQSLNPVAKTSRNCYCLKQAMAIAISSLIFCPVIRWCLSITHDGSMYVCQQKWCAIYHQQKLTIHGVASIYHENIHGSRHACLSVSSPGWVSQEEFSEKPSDDCYRFNCQGSTSSNSSQWTELRKEGWIEWSTEVFHKPRDGEYN